MLSQAALLLHLSTPQRVNRGSCILVRTAASAVSAGEYWNGVSCTTSSGNCDYYISRALVVANELRAMRSRMQTICSINQSGQDCLDLIQRHQEGVLRYTMLLTEAPASCRAGLPEPSSL